MTHFLPDVQLPRDAIIGEIRVGRRLEQFGGLSVFVLHRRLYSRFRTAVEFGRTFFDFVLFTEIVRDGVPEDVLVVFAGDGLYGGRGTGAVLFPGANIRRLDQQVMRTMNLPPPGSF